MSNTLLMSATGSEHDTIADRIQRGGGHIAELDGVRGLAIVIVTLYRFARDFPTTSAFEHWLNTGLRAGGRGVELFFVLSGLLITGILLDTRRHPRYFSSFMARRALRIFPLYFASLVLFLWILPQFEYGQRVFEAGVTRQAYLWTYLPNVRMAMENAWCFGPLDHFWSLAVEEHFYLLWPLLILILPLRLGTAGVMGLAVVVAGSRMLFCWLSKNELAPAVLTPFRMDALLVGAVLAFQLRSEQGLQPWRKLALIGAPILLAFCIAIELDGRRWLTVSDTLWPMMWAACLIVLLTSKSETLIAGLMRNRFLILCGGISYAMYVFQSPLLGLVQPLGLPTKLIEATGSSLLALCVFVASMFALTMLLAWLSWHLLEKHCLALKRYFPTSLERQQVGGARPTAV